MTWDDHLLVLKSLLTVGLPATVKLTLLCVALSLLVGLVLGIVRSFKIPVVDQILGLYAQICRGIPVMIILLFMYATLASGTPYSISVLAIVFVEGAYFMETVKGGLLSIDPGQWEAAKSLALPLPTTLVRIIIPQVFLTILPAMIGQVVLLVKGTSVASTIGAMELTRRAQGLLPMFPHPLIIYGYVLIIFFVLCHALTMLGRKLEKSTVKKIMGDTHVE